MGMRTIKFRAWDEADKTIRKVTAINWYDECVYMDETPMTGVRRALANLNLMQFTGLLDKNGKEIYEGDVLKHEHDAVSSVEWLDGCFVVRHWWNKKPSDCDFIAVKNKFEIIGNIYENPELLK